MHVTLFIALDLEDVCLYAEYFATGVFDCVAIYECCLALFLD